VSDPACTGELDSFESAGLKRREEISMSTIVQEGLFLSELLGAHDISDFVPEVVGISAGVTGYWSEAMSPA